MKIQNGKIVMEKGDRVTFSVRASDGALVQNLHVSVDNLLEIPVPEPLSSGLSFWDGMKISCSVNERKRWYE